MEEHKLLDILIHFRTLIITTDKIKQLDPTVTFTDDFFVKKQVFLDKLLFLLNEIEDISPNDEKEKEIESTVDIGLKLNSMSNLLGGEQIIESGDINPAAFDNFGSGLARLLGGGGGLPIATSLRGSDARPNVIQQIQQIQPQQQIQLPINQKKNENLTFNIKKKSTDGI
jgi:hypothetical protein